MDSKQDLTEMFLAIIADYNYAFENNPDMPNFILTFISDMLIEFQQGTIDIIKNKDDLKVEEYDILLIEHSMFMNCMILFIDFLKKHGKTKIDVEEAKLFVEKIETN